MRTLLSSTAARELVGESSKYESKAEGLGTLFIQEFESAVGQIQRFPESGSRFGVRFRRVLMRRFPYAIVYSPSGQVLRIVAIMHQHRGPEFIASRLDKE